LVRYFPIVSIHPREGEVLLKAYSARHQKGEVIQLTQKEIEMLKVKE
jgi:hypothetical protein